MRFKIKKYWFWFKDPVDVPNAAMVNFFSYNKVDKEGFFRKEGWTTIINTEKELELLWLNMRRKFIRNVCELLSLGSISMRFVINSFHGLLLLPKPLAFTSRLK